MREGVRILRPSSNIRDHKLVVIVAGEASADLHGSNLVKAMRHLNPRTLFWGIGGKQMEQAGVKILVPSSDMAVVGVTEVFPRLHCIVRARAKLKNVLRYNRPDLLILIDYPDFNIHIARIAKRFRIPVLYYISPQIWAWRKRRVKKIAKRVDRMAVIFPFEEEFYGRSGLDVTYVGHPVLDSFNRKHDKNEIRGNMGLSDAYPVLGLLPGSRTEEVRNLLPLMIKAIEILSSRYHDMECILPVATTISYDWIKSMTGKSSVRIRLCSGDIHKILTACDIALVASGTATLEMAVNEIPMVIIYQVSAISNWIGRRVIKVPFIGLVNLVAGERIVPELIQDQVTPRRMAEESVAILEDSHLRENMIKKLEAVRESLGRGGASEKTAEIAIDMMNMSEAAIWPGPY